MQRLHQEEALALTFDQSRSPAKPSYIYDDSDAAHVLQDEYHIHRLTLTEDQKTQVMPSNILRFTATSAEEGQETQKIYHHIPHEELLPREEYKGN